MKCQWLGGRALAVFLMLAGAMWAPPSGARAAEPGAPDQAAAVIARFQQTLLSVMKNAKTLGYAGRYKELAPAVTESHNLGFIARVVVGQYWTQLDGKQRSEFVDTFTRLSIATYASQFDGYSGESFATVGTRTLPTGDMVVQTELTKSDGSKVHLDYLMRNSDGRWQIINVVADGVSDLALKRAQYTSIIKDQGFGTLLEKLKEKIAQYAKDGNKAS